MHDSYISQFFASLVTWTSIPEWQSMRNNWPNLSSAVDGTSTEIYRLMIEPQPHYYSGHGYYHAIQSGSYRQYWRDPSH